MLTYNIVVLTNDIVLTNNVVPTKIIVLTNKTLGLIDDEVLTHSIIVLTRERWIRTPTGPFRCSPHFSRYYNLRAPTSQKCVVVTKTSRV